MADFSPDEVVDIPFDKLLDNLQSPIPKTEKNDSEMDRPAESVADSLLAEQQQQQLKNGTVDYANDTDSGADDDDDDDAVADSGEDDDNKDDDDDVDDVENMSASDNESDVDDENDHEEEEEPELKRCPDCSEMIVSTMQCNTCTERKRRYLCFWCIGLFDDTNTLLEHEKCCSQSQLIESGSGEVGIRVKVAKSGAVVLSEIGTQTGRGSRSRRVLVNRDKPIPPLRIPKPKRKAPAAKGKKSGPGRPKKPTVPKPPKPPKPKREKRKTKAQLKREEEEKDWDPTELVQCHICHKRFKNKDYLQKHNDLHHLLVPCGMCGLGVVRKDFHKHEKKFHNSEFKCQVEGCDKQFKSRHSLRDHDTVHTGVRAFVCDECGKDFRTKDGLSKHKKHHKGLRPHICTYCGKRFTDSGSRKYHEGTHLKQRPTNFKCKFCGRGYKTYVGVYLHERIHTGKTFKCSYCNKDFNAKTHLTRHLWIHTGEFPYYCPLCTRNFRDVHAMKVHKCLSKQAGGGVGKPVSKEAREIIVKEAEVQHQKELAKSRLLYGKGAKKPRVSTEQKQKAKREQQLNPDGAAAMLTQEQLAQERLNQEQRLVQERLNQERLASQGRMNQDRLVEPDRMSQERLGQDRLSQDGMPPPPQEHLGQDRMNQERLSQERIGQERMNHHHQERQYPIIPSGFPDPRQDLRELQDLRDLRDDHHPPPHHQIPNRQESSQKDTQQPNTAMHWGDGRMSEPRQKQDPSSLQPGLQGGLHAGIPAGVPFPWTSDGRMPVPLQVPSSSDSGLRHKDIPSSSRLQEQSVHHMDPMRQYRDVHTMMLQKYMAEQAAGQAMGNLPMPPWGSDGRVPEGWQRDGHIQKLHSHAQPHAS